MIPLLRSLYFNGKADINHKEFWEDKLENVWKHITRCASYLPVCAQIHSLPFLVLFYITRANPANIVQAPLPFGVFMGLTRQKFGGSKAERDQDTSLSFLKEDLSAVALFPPRV